MGRMEYAGGGNKEGKDSSYEFWRKGGKKGQGEVEEESDGEEFDFRNTGEDPPSKLISQFLHKQQASGDFSLDMDLEMQELKQDNADMGLAQVVESPPLRSADDTPKERTTSSGKSSTFSGEDVVRCNSTASYQSNSSFRRRSRLLAPPKNNKSRLLDSPERKPGKSPRSAQSGRVCCQSKTQRTKKKNPF